MSDNSAYQKTELNSAFFSPEEDKLDNYFQSTKYFFTKDLVVDNMSFLDIGGAGGGLAAAVNNEIATIKATIVDPDSNVIALGKKKYPHFNFVNGFFPDAMKQNDKFDYVSMQALFPQIPDWKAMLLSLRNVAKKYLNISMILKLDGTTIVDKDISYFYYLDSGQRVHQVVHNIYELYNFLCIHEMNVKAINFFGYHTPYSGHNFRCVPNSQQIKGNLLLTFFDEGQNPKRFGGAVEKGTQSGEYVFFEPQTTFMIDNKQFDIKTGTFNI
jgi:hypothetical protein